MKMKKTLTAVVAMALVAAVSVAGTMAYLTKDARPVTNTFTAGKLGGDRTFKLELLETPVEQQSDGTYELQAEGTPSAQGNNYTNILPGSTNKKDPHVNVAGLETDAYLFIEVVNIDPNIIAEVDTNNWTMMTGVTPKTENAKVYMYKNDGKVAKNTDLNKVYVLKDNEFHVANFGNDAPSSFNNLTVNAYICQAAGLETAEKAWGACFANK